MNEVSLLCGDVDKEKNINNIFERKSDEKDKSFGSGCVCDGCS